MVYEAYTGGMATGMELLRAKRGLLAQVARALGLTKAAVGRWERVPAERVVAVERITGISRKLLRPDLYECERAAE